MVTAMAMVTLNIRKKRIWAWTTSAGKTHGIPFCSQMEHCPQHRGLPVKSRVMPMMARSDALAWPVSYGRTSHWPYGWRRKLRSLNVALIRISGYRPRFFALALDGSKRKVDSLTSNIGHLLWSGIVDNDKAPKIVEHLMGPELFSGWGVRTMAMSEVGYSPIEYHNGTVWPHDNSIIAAGLARYGFRREAAK